MTYVLDLVETREVMIYPSCPYPQGSVATDEPHSRLAVRYLPRESQWLATYLDKQYLSVQHLNAHHPQIMRRSIPKWQREMVLHSDRGSEWFRHFMPKECQRW
ncbi:MAG: hypothetical protein NW214_05475 [Pseudanabaenaceae cyanobacterium bins.39]|nr:hypothetical protein [Pseudanabaenaceae cyanobacterium bins.39]